MKMLAMPSPSTRRIHSSKSLGLVVAVELATSAVDKPAKHLIYTEALQHVISMPKVSCDYQPDMSARTRALHVHRREALAA